MDLQLVGRFEFILVGKNRVGQVGKWGGLGSVWQFLFSVVQKQNNIAFTPYSPATTVTIYFMHQLAVPQRLIIGWVLEQIDSNSHFTQVDTLH